MSNANQDVPLLTLIDAHRPMELCGVHPAEGGVPIVEKGLAAIKFNTLTHPKQMSQSEFRLPISKKENDRSSE